MHLQVLTYTMHNNSVSEKLSLLESLLHIESSENSQNQELTSGGSEYPLSDNEDKFECDVSFNNMTETALLSLVLCQEGEEGNAILLERASRIFIELEYNFANGANIPQILVCLLPTNHKTDSFS